MTYLHGITDYGDAVEDEWLIVYMLRQLTQSFPDLWVRIADADGEILLIEAANVLPKWITPEIDQNRVWIHASKLFILPLSSTDQTQQNLQPTTTITLRKAIDYLRTKPNALVYSPLIESEAFYRLEKYPEHVRHSMHYSLVTVPRKLAYTLHSLPKSISRAVEMFYLRDAIALKPIISANSPLIFPPEDFVTTSIQFSKVLFAQLKSQRFEAPPRWQPLIQDPSQASSAELPNLSRREMGMKLTCGFEMLAVNADRSKHRIVRELALLLQDLSEDGDASLPSDHEIMSWPNQQRNDVEDWMDINYQDFERELDGKGSGTSKGEPSGFGDAQTQSDLKKIVSRFEAFLNDDKAGLDGVEIDEMDDDDHEDTDNDSEDSEFEDKAVSFDEEAFSRMMREMMGIPEEPVSNVPMASPKVSEVDRRSSSERLNRDSDELQELSSQMEAELKGHGALNLTSEVGADLKSSKQIQSQDNRQPARLDPVAEESEGELNIDYNLARNILESFKGQAGMAGPTGNLLGLMGFTLPRDEDDKMPEN